MTSSRETQDRKYMARCLELAEQGGRSVMPNPMVGCVLVSNGEVAAEGFHQKCGGPHAEVEALNSISSIPEDAVLYVNLEPCSHHGKTPPCADLIIEKGIKKVVIGAPDINPEVSGRGVEKLLKAGIEVVSGVLLEDCVDLNSRFYINHKYERPYIILKWAETADGFIARDDYSSKWISGEESRKLVHTFRSQEASILVGTNTAQHDDPSLTVRHVEGVDPIRIVIDKELRLSKDLKLFSGEVETLVINAVKEEVVGTLQYLKLDFETGFLDELLSRLWTKGISSLFVEGGARTLQSFIDAGLWDECRKFTGTASFGSGVAAPRFDLLAEDEGQVGEDLIQFYYNTHLDGMVEELRGKFA